MGPGVQLGAGKGHFWGAAAGPALGVCPMPRGHLVLILGQGVGRAGARKGFSPAESTPGLKRKHAMERPGCGRTSQKLCCQK